MATRIKHVQGNVLRLQVPLTVKRVSVDNGSVVEVEEDFYPGTAYPASIIFKSSLKRSFPASINGNVVSMQDLGTLATGLYQVEVVCHDDGGNPFRYMVRDIIEIVDATAEAGIAAGVEIDSEIYTLDGALFIGFAQEQSDWTETDNTKVPYIKNKPTSLSQFAEDATHRTVTDAEKAAWSAKYDKPSGGIPATDLASGVIPDVSVFATTADLAEALDDYTTTSDLSDLLDDKADAATTLAGYGITDAKIESGVITLGSSTITPLTSHQDITGKADIVTSATEGNLAALDSSGNLTDSGYDAADFATAAQGAKADTALQSESDPVFTASAAAGITSSDITAWNGKADAATTLAGYGITDAKIASGTITLGSSSITPLTSHQDITGKADKVTGATSGNFAALDSNGNLTDSGHKHSDYLTSHQSVTDGDPTLAWSTRSKVATVGSTDIHVTMPSNPNPVPAPTSSDSGKVLSVTDTSGTIAWTTPTGGGGDVNVIETVKVNGTALTPDANKAVDVPVPEVYDVTYGTTTGAQIKAAYDAGKTLRLIDSDGSIYPLTYYHTNSSGDSIDASFSCIVDDGAQLYTKSKHLGSDLNRDIWDEVSVYVPPISTDITTDGAFNSKATSPKAVKTFVEGKGYTTNTGTVTSVGVSVPTGLSVSGTPVMTSGTIAISLASGYSIPTDAKQTAWDAKYDLPSGGIPATDIASGVIPDLTDYTDAELQTAIDTAFANL